MPEKGLEYAERASQMGSGSRYTETLAQAYVANDRYEEALEQLKQRLNTMEQEAFGRWLSSWISRAGKNATDKGRYVEMLDTLVNTAPNNLKDRSDVNLKLAEFCRENAMPEKAKTYVQKTGVITEDVMAQFSDRLTIPKESVTTRHTSQKMQHRSTQPLNTTV